MDATYFGRSWGMLVGMEASTGRIVYYAYLTGTEKTADYREALDTLLGLGYQIQAVAIDGRRGVRELCVAYGLPVQYCQFHQLLTITECLTKNPKLPANIDLRRIALTITRTTRADFEVALNAWYVKYGKWLKERDPETKRMIHRRTRRAYFSLRRNLHYLFTCQDYPNTYIPNTTNKLDGSFGVWKELLKYHRGCNKSLKTKLLVSFLSGASDKSSN